ncbi:rhodanese-like domain-containing protein [Shimia sp. W99]
MNRRTMILGLAVLPLIPHVASANPLKISAGEALSEVQDDKLILIDVRRPEEWQSTGVAEGAWLLDMTHKQFGPRFLAVLERNPNHKIAIICRTGNRTGYLMKVLAENGISGVLDVSEGMAGGPNGKGWIPSGLPLQSAEEALGAMPKDLTKG